ncbi:MAG: ATP-binding protein [Acidobacteriota bacterium]
MSFLSILKLVGFATGAALHVYITWLIWKRRLGSKQTLTQYERTFVVLGICLSIWFVGNLSITLHELLLGRNTFPEGLRIWNTLTMTGVALLPAALLHAHIAFYALIDNYKKITARQVRWSAILVYLPMLFLPLAIYLVNKGAYDPFLIKLRKLLLPYSIWYLLTLWTCAAIDWVIARKLDERATRERQFFKRLAVQFVFNGAFEFIAVGIRRVEPGDIFWVSYMLLSLLPTFLVAYHIYRYKIIDIAIKDSIVYASSAVVFIVIYVYGIRQLGQFLVERYNRPGYVIEAILILGIFALAGPFVRFMDRTVRGLFTQEIELYRDVVRQVTRGAEGFGELSSLLHYVEETIRRGLELTDVKIFVIEKAAADSPEQRLATKMQEWQSDFVENDEDVAALKANAVYALKREGNLIGLLAIAAEPHTLTSEKRALLDVLAGQVAVEVETGLLIEEKIRLERELANRERLATLGQMATTIAHEVKNPLSSIKSIAQVMREEDELKNYDRDLQIIVSEIDRLNHTVSQLLSFARPGRADTEPVSLTELISATVALFSKEAHERGVNLTAQVADEQLLSGTQAAALREVIGNLILNAIQATESGGAVTVEAKLASDNPTNGKNKKQLAISIRDTGSGISIEEQQRVFEPFYTTKSRGTGLGLAIVQRRIVELGGAVELLSPVMDNHGTEFRLRVPVE